MYLSNLTLFNFKNYSDLDLDLAEKTNCFVGDNGMGKTNLLDAIYYLSFCKSFFNPIDSQNIREGESHFSIQGKYQFDGKEDKVMCLLKKGQKKQFKRNKKEYDKLADHIGSIPLVMISPADVMLVIGGSEVRRKFMDGILAQFDKSYFQQLLNYNRIVQQRNALLKKMARERSHDYTQVEVWDDQLNEYGTAIHERRKTFLTEFIPFFQDYYNRISQEKEEVSLEYKSQLDEAPLHELLTEYLQKDLAVQYTSAGIHKDDLEFRIRGRSLKKFASQGQQKSYLLALKLAQAAYMARIMDIKPILLVDDIYDKLDLNRVGQLIRLLSQDDFGQLFITDTNPDHIGEMIREMNSEYRIFNVNNGEVIQIEL